MRGIFPLLMLLGALLGLLGQEAAVAHVMPAASLERASAAADAGMSADCAETMGVAKQENRQPGEPCHGITPECIAKMGCALPLAAAPPIALGAPEQARALDPGQLPVASLTGRETGPDPHPPARLG